MNKKDLEVLKRLMNDKDIKGKKSLERFIWLNTVPPKYEVGELVKVTDSSITINGSRVIDWIGRVEEITTVVGELKYTYQIKVKYIAKDNTTKETTVFANEYNMKKTRAKNDVNKPINTKEEVTTDISIGW